MAGLKPLLSPENSIVAAAATIGIVAGIYALDVGPVSTVHMTATGGPEAGAAASTIRKAGWTSLVAVGAITLLARDPNILIMGGAAIIAFHAHYRHSALVNPGTGQIEAPGPAAYAPAEYVTPRALQPVAS